MWELVNRSKLLAERSFARDRDGSEVLIVVLKGTFDWEGQLCAEQVPIQRVPIHRGDPASSSLLYESDHTLGKPATDVLVHGTARAARAEPTLAMEVGLQLGPIAKRLAVVGDRRWSRGQGDDPSQPVQLSDATPFVSMPLVWERAYGGQDGSAGEPRNPCGVGYGTSLGGKMAPNILPLGSLIYSPSDPPAPVGFGPVARHWQPRLALGGTHDERWRRERMPLVPIDYDPRFEQCAPADQQVSGYLRGGEPFELTGMSESGSLRGKLPVRGLTIKAKLGGAWVHSEPAIHTVVLEPDLRRAIVTWHAAIPCHRTLYSLRRVVVHEERLGG